MLKLNIIVTLNMLETNFATLHTKNTIVIKIEKWQMLTGKFLQTQKVHYWLKNFRILCNTKYPDNS